MDGGQIGKWERYIPIVSGRLNEDIGISGEAKRELNDMLEDLSAHISRAAVIMSQNCRTMTVSAREVQAAVRVILPGELSRVCIINATKAVSLYLANEKKRGSRESKANLVFPVARAEADLRSVNNEMRDGGRVSNSAPVYLAAVLEYITTEVVELAGNTAKDGGKKRISKVHMEQGIQNDEELNKLLM